MNSAQLAQMKSGKGFIAALDQSGGSTPKALSLYGIEPNTYSGEAAMFDLVHKMRSRIIKSPSFTSERVIGVILFEMTMDRQIDGLGSAEFLWQKKNIVPFLKVDNGLADEVDGAQIMKPIPELDARLTSAISHGVFGTKMRSVIKQANAVGVKAVVEQQFEIGKQICAKGLVPIIEPEVDIKCPDKAAAEDLLLAELVKQLDKLGDNQNVMLKLTLPEKAGLYTPLTNHPRVVRVVALSGGYSRDHANEVLAKNPNVIASFSRALSEGLTAQQTDSEFDAMIDKTIQAIYEASIK
ncbi:MAG: fructose-1,6-bisphosphate aldolase [Actinobacteria bacterium BACL4 MAG-120507-bin0]|jgi:fructose-bisphosphate aldolase, class I|uniref:fructose bisphosphate aldolase n=1 Tax=Candidatus Nanopelagicus sp. TaxID=2518620 RepID=UPI000712EFD7|nr:MAG: fructose-1,6-bisphosphate aldolase [Actinobacteria bacterium BACL4 MAG-121001-bin59]KRO92727.1 MAG: fructose-1,6-bisphosphate aldolase [Actinobacteria bacterium BACL4 MAG-120507-bin0]